MLYMVTEAPTNLHHCRSTSIQQSLFSAEKIKLQPSQTHHLNMAYQKIAIAGATGNLGPTIVQALVDAGFDVTILSQSGNTTGLPSAAKTVKVNYAYGSQHTIVDALKGQDVFISMIPQHDSQPALIDAAIAAGVKRFIPSEFGSNISGNAKTAALPVFKGKGITQDYLKQKSSQISYTLINNGLFLDWGMQVGISIDLKGGATRVFDGGNDKHSFTLLGDIGKAVVGVLKHPEETKNRAVYVQSAALSQNELIEIARKAKPGVKIDRQEASIEQLLEDSHKQLAADGDQIGTAMFGFIVVSIFGDSKEYGNVWSGKNDNELLGIKELTKRDLETLIAGL
jgi:uncharacterized protein YbjT (DUF2867 family)